MEISKDISLLKEAGETDKLDLYKKIINGMVSTASKEDLNLSEKDLEEFSQEIKNSLLHSFSKTLLDQLEVLIKDCKSVKCIFTEKQVNDIIEGIINVIKVCEDETILILCYSCLTETLTITRLKNDMLEDILGKAAEILCKKTIPVSVYTTVCSYVQKCFKHNENLLSCYMHIIPKLVYPPLSHTSGKVREIAEKTLDDIPKLVLYAENEDGSNALLKLIKESYCKELLLLLKEKQELYVLKVWKAIVTGLGKTLHRNLPTITPFFQVIEKGFKSQDDEICKTAFICWKSLISNFAMDDAVLNDSKKLRFVLKPFRNLSKFSELVSFAVCETWWHLAWSLSHNLSARFDEVLMPLLEFTFGKNTKSQIFLVKRGVHILLRLLEQPQNNSLNRISSPKKLPPLIFPPLQVPLELKVIIRHSKEIMSMMKVVIETFGSVKDMASHIDCLLKSVLSVLSSVIEDKNKESVETVISFVNFVNDVIESQLCSPLTCLKCVDSLSKLPRFVLVSHYFHCGPRKQDVLCTSLLRLLVNPYLFTTEISNKRFLMAYNRLIQAALGESLNPLSMAHKLINIVKQVTSVNLDAEILFEMWSGIASPLLEAIEKTQEVNQGTGQEHDFSCLYDVLLCPFENIFPVSLNQLRTKPAFRLWTNLYKAFVRCAALVSTTVPNEVCGHFCTRLKNYFKDELLKEPQYFETVCFLLQVVLEPIDFSSVVPPSTPVFASPSMLLKKKKPLGNLSSFVELLSMLLTSFYSNYVENEDDIYQSCTPKAQRKGHISKAAAPLDLVKAFFGSLKSGVVISSALEELAPSLSKLLAISVTKTQIAPKFEVLWNVLLSAIEMHYLGPYDTDFLNAMSPLLESGFTHPRRHIKERSRRFWFATFAPVSASLIIPESLKTVLKKSKLSLMPDEQVSSLEECSLNPISDSIEDEVNNFEKPNDIKDSFIKPLDVKEANFKFGVKEADVKQTVDKKTPSKKNVDELPSDEFVAIDSPASLCLTPKRRSIRRRKSFVPAMYNDLSQSQDTTTLGGSSESFDTSSSCEIMEFKTQEESEKIPSSNHESIGDLEEAEKSQEIELSIEVISSQNNIPANEKEMPTLQDANNIENEVTSTNTKVLLEKTTNISEIVENGTHSAENIIESSDVVIVTSSETVSPQELGIDSKNLTKEMPEKEEIEDSLHDLQSSKQCEPRLTRCRGRKRNTSGEVFDSQEMVKNGHLAGNTKKDSKLVSKDENDTIINKKAVEVDSDELQGSQKNGSKKFKANVEPTIENKTLAKKNVKSKQNSIATHFKKTSKTNHKKHLQQQGLSESLPNCTDISKLSEQSILSKLNQTSIELIDIGDSEEIIPSSQSSGDSINSIKLPDKEMTTKNLKRMLKFDHPEDSENKMCKVENNSEASFVKETICLKAGDLNTEECPETPTDLMQPDDIVAEVVNQASAFVTKTIGSMPLKSSENLVMSEEHLNKTENKAIKTVLSDVLMKTSDEKKVFIAENKPPLFTEVYNVQTSEPVIMLDKLCVEEEKIKISLEESPKTVRIKSLRSANKNTARKSFSSADKKGSKKSARRKSMPALNVANKIDKLEVDENMDSETNSDQLVSSNDIEEFSETISKPEDEAKKINECLTSMDDDDKFDNEQNSVLEDINKVILDIHEKIQSYNNEGYSCDFNLSEKIELEQDSDKDCFLSSNEPVGKVGFNEAGGNLEDDEMEEIDVVSVDNQDDSELNENVGSYCKVSGEPTNTDVCLNSTQKHVITDKNLDVEDDLIEKSSKKNVSNLHKVPISNEASVTDSNLKTDTPTDDFRVPAQFAKNNEMESSKVVDECKLSDHDAEGKDDATSQSLEVVTDLQLNPNSAVCTSRQSNYLKSEKDDKESNKVEAIVNNVLDVVASENIEKCEASDNVSRDKTMQDPQIQILGVASLNEKYSGVFENLDKENVPDSVIVDILGSAGEKITAGAHFDNSASQNKINVDEMSEEIKTTSEAEIDREKLSSTFETSKIELDTCSSEIEEIEETCDIVIDQHFPKKLVLEQKSTEVIVNGDATENIIDEVHEDITKLEQKGVLPLEELCETNDFKENEKCVESSHNETVQEKILELYANKNITIIKLASDSKLPVKSESFSKVSGQEICDVGSHSTDTDSHKTVGDEMSAELKDSDPSNVSSIKTSSITEINCKETESSSRRRKPKCPVRSPFNFRNINRVVHSLSHTIPKDNEQNSGKVTAKKPLPNMQNKASENTAKKIKKHIEPKIKNASSVTVQNGNKLDMPLGNANSSHDQADQELRKAISAAKRLKVVVNIKEMTDVNTRYNASIAPQTRRLKMLANVHNSQPDDEDEQAFNENDSAFTEDDNSVPRSSTSILKKRKASSEGSHSKLRKVTFADPLVEERLFSNNDNLSERILRVSAQMNIGEQQNIISSSEVEKVNETNAQSSDEISSSSEYQNSDNLTDYNHLPISPLLVNCEESISCIIKDLTSPTWAQGLMTLLLAKNIKTIGDLCKLNVHELKALPIKSPKVSCLHKALLAHLQHTQEINASKLNLATDWCAGTASSENKNKENEPDVNQEDEKMDEIIGSETLESIASELLTNDRIGQLKRETLLALSKKCFQEVTKRLEDH